MSIQSQIRRITVPEIRAHKDAKPIVCLTCYHAHTAKLLDSHVDLILVGDTLGMVIHGMETTLGVTVEMMILHGQAVMRGSQRARQRTTLKPTGSARRSRNSVSSSRTLPVGRPGAGDRCHPRAGSDPFPPSLRKTPSPGRTMTWRAGCAGLRPFA